MKKLKTLAVALMLAGTAMAADDKVMLNFVNSDIDSTVKAVGLITGKNFVLDPRVKGTVNVVSSSPVPRHDVYSILLSALRLQGFAVVESNGAVKIVPEADAKQNTGATVARKLNIDGDRIVTQVYPLKNESAAQLVPILRPLITPNNSIAAYPNSNLLVITDYAENVRRLDQIIENVDQPSEADFATLPLKYASATDVAQTISKLMPEVSVPGGTVIGPAVVADGVRKTVVLPDVRANMLLIRGDNPAHVAQIKKIAESLDRQGASGGNIHVVYLKNADAPRLAATLKAILTGGDVPAMQSAAFTSVTSNNGSNGGAPSAAPVAAPSSSLAVSSGGGSGGQNLPGVAIQADPATNALIITAPDNIYTNILSVIDKLDARRAQVYVEAMIAEVSVDKSGQFGVQWLVGGGNNKVNAVGLSNIGTTGSSLSSIAAAAVAKDPSSLPTGLMLGVVNGSLTSDGKMPTLGAIATALESHGDGNVLSMPNLLTLDNEEATILVGQNIPIVTGTQASTGSNQTPFTTVDRKDIGIKLKVRPQISEGGVITMQVSQEVSGIDKTVSTQGTGIATTKRSIDSKVLVDDGQVIVLGGLIENTINESDNRVPLLGDIPLLGNLFRYQNREHKRTNLMVFLRPVVLRDGKSASALSNERYRLLQDAQADYHPDKHLLLPDLPGFTLPSLNVPHGYPVSGVKGSDVPGVANVGPVTPVIDATSAANPPAKQP